MIDYRHWALALYHYLHEFRHIVQCELDRFVYALEDWVNALISRPLPPDWRRQTAAFLLEWEREGFQLTPRGLDTLDWWIEAWAARRGFLPKAPGNAASSAGRVHQPTPTNDVAEASETGRAPPESADGRRGYSSRRHDSREATAEREFDGDTAARYNRNQWRTHDKSRPVQAPVEADGGNANLDRQAAHGPTNSPDRKRSKLGIELRDLYLKRAGLGALIITQAFTGFFEWLTDYHWSFQDDGSIENAQNSRWARHAFMIQNALNSGVPTDGQWHKVYAGNVDIYKTISKARYEIFIEDEANTPMLNQASFWLGGLHEFRAKGSYEITLCTHDGFVLADFRNIQMVWGWVDEVDARSAIEYSWLVDGFGQGLVETTIGDILGDKILNGNYKAVIGFWQTGQAGTYRYNLTTKGISTVP